MANTQDFWAEKLRSFIPGCIYQGEEVDDAIIQGIAAVLTRLEASLDDHQGETFICQALEGFLDEHGLERNTLRQTNELDITYRERIKNIVNSTSCVEIKRIVDALLDVGEATILEDFEAQLFFDREDAFFDRGNLFIDVIYNAFSIIVDKQVHAPYSFMDREYMLDREEFMGTGESSLTLFELIVEAVNRAKALGIAYRLVERLV